MSPRPRVRRNVVMAVLAALALGAFLVWALQDPAPDGAAREGLGWITDANPHNHLHGIGYDAAEGRLFLATHFGLFVHEAGRVQAVPGPVQDFMGFSLHPHDASAMYASGHPASGGNLGVVRSLDGGVTWQQIFTGVAAEVVDFHSMAVSAADPDVLAGWFSGLLYVSEDAGASWRADDPLPSGPCWGAACLALDPHDRARVYAGTQAGLLVSNDLGATWREVAPGPHAGVFVHPADGSLHAHSLRDGVRVSHDGGRTWTQHPIGPVGQNVVFQFAADPGDAARLFAATTASEVHVTSDGGASWQLLLP